MKTILHIGPFKTGSTTIQAALAQNRTALSERSVYVPTLGTVFKGHGERGLPARFTGDGPLTEPLPNLPWSTPTEARKLSDDCWDQIARDVQQKKPEVMLISSEFFSIVKDFDGLKKRLNSLSDDIFVVAYVRDPVSLFVSQIQQKIRIGTCFAKLPNPFKFTYFPRTVLENFTREFGGDRVIVRNFERENLYKSDITYDFMSTVDEALGLNLSDQLTLPPRQNESIPGALAAWILMSDEMSGPAGFGRHRSKMLSFLSEHTKIQPMDKMKLDDPILVAAIRGNCDSDSNWINEHFLADQVKLPTMSHPVEVDPQDVRQRFRKWFQSYLTPADVRIITNILMFNSTKMNK